MTEETAVVDDDKAVINYLQKQLADKQSMIEQLEGALILYRDLAAKMNELSGILFEPVPKEESDGE